MKSITVRQLRNDSGRVLKEVGDGESFTITSNGHPVAELSPHRPARGPRRLVPLGELLGAWSDLPEVDAGQWVADAREGIVDEVGDPWERRVGEGDPGGTAAG